MVKRRADPWYKEADRAYPIRVKFAVPEKGASALGRGTPLHDWLQANLGPKMWNWAPAHSSGCRQATAYYFRRIEDAQAFIAAFPQLELADGVPAPIDTDSLVRRA